jgi:hypothetical protein
LEVEVDLGQIAANLGDVDRGVRSGRGAVTRELALLASATDCLGLLKDKLLKAKNGRMRAAIDSKQAARMTALLGTLSYLKEGGAKNFRKEWQDVVYDFPSSIYGVSFRFQAASDDSKSDGEDNEDSHSDVEYVSGDENDEELEENGNRNTGEQAFAEAS